MLQSHSGDLPSQRSILLSVGLLAAFALLASCNGSPPVGTTRPAATNPTTIAATEAITVTPIPYPTSPYPKLIFDVRATVDCFDTLGIDDPARPYTGGRRGLDSRKEGIRCFRVGDTKEAFAFYDQQFLTSVVLIFDAPKAPESQPGLDLNTSSHTLDAWLIRHTQTSQAEFDSSEFDADKLASFWSDFLRMSRESRIKADWCFPLHGTAKMELAANAFVRRAELTFETDAPLPPYAQWVDLSLGREVNRILDEITSGKKIAADGQTEIAAEKTAAQNVKRTHTDRKCMMSGKINPAWAGTNHIVWP
jgi:hypothetical protein